MVDALNDYSDHREYHYANACFAVGPLRPKDQLHRHSKDNLVKFSC